MMGLGTITAIEAAGLKPGVDNQDSFGKSHKLEFEAVKIT